MFSHPARPAALALMLALALAAPAEARSRPPAGAPPAPGGIVNLPYQVQDNQGVTWMLYGSGWLQQQGNNPMYSQAAVLHVNQNQPTMNVNTARVDGKTGEIVFENMPCLNTTVTRRVKLDKDAGVARYIDVIKNTQNVEQTVQLMIQTSLNYGVNAANTLEDPKRKDRSLAWVAATSGNRTVVELFNGKGAKQGFSINYQPGNSQVNANMSLVLPPGREVAVMHFHTTSADPVSAASWVQGIKESQLLKDVPLAVRKQIVNFAGGQNFVGDHEILRGDLFDVVELRTGDQYRGTIKEPSFKLATFYGPVELPVDRVIGLINVGEFRPRQLIVTADGEIFGGRLDRESIAIELSSGQVTRVPLSQVTRLGYRKRPGEPEEWTFDKPLVLLRSGDRMGIQVPAGAIDVATRYGPLKLKPQAVAAISFANDEHGVHEVFLADGSKFAGLVTAETFDLKLSPAAGGTSISIPTSAIARLQLAARPEEPEDDAPTLALTNDDQLVGALSGKLKLETAFDTLVLDAPQIKSLRHARNASARDVQVTLWDDTTVSGQLAETDLTCDLRCGMAMKVPVALVDEYSQPFPQPSEALVKRVKEYVQQLNGDDWKSRDRAQADLVALGPIVAATLKQLRTEQPPEARQRIDAVLKEFDKRRDPTPPPAGGDVPIPADINLPQGAVQPVQPQIQIIDGPVGR